jgi:hypothetical protein
VQRRRRASSPANAPTRMFVPADRHDEAKAIAKATADKLWSVT